MMAADKDEWAGLPVPLMGERLTIEKSYFGAEMQDEINRLTMRGGPSLRVCHIDDEAEQTALRNTFWSSRHRCEIRVWQIGGRFVWDMIPGVHHFDQDLTTLGCADAWSLETEQRALEALRTMVTHQAFRQYLLTGSFLESSKRSKVAYMFRRLRPTVAISSSTGRLRILASLCQHPIAYYQGSWAGAMCPTDDVLSHLMLMRGDEHMFWKRSNQHPPHRPEAGL